MIFTLGFVTITYMTIEVPCLPGQAVRRPQKQQLALQVLLLLLLLLLASRMFLSGLRRCPDFWLAAATVAAACFSYCKQTESYLVQRDL